METITDGQLHLKNINCLNSNLQSRSAAAINQLDNDEATVEYDDRKLEGNFERHILDIINQDYDEKQ